MRASAYKVGMRSPEDVSEAARLLDRALAIRESSFGSEHLTVAKNLADYADLQMLRGNYAGAGPLYERGLTIVEKILGPDHPDVAESLNGLAWLSQVKGD